MIPPSKDAPSNFIPAPGSPRSDRGWEPADTFAINFIRPRSFFSMNRRLIFFATLGYFIAQGLLLVLLVLWGLALNAEAVHLNRSFRKAFPSSSSNGEFKTQLDQLSQRGRASLAALRTAIAIERDKFRIAGKLAGIVRTVPVRTWVSSVRLDSSNRSMGIEAGFLVDMRNPYQLPAKSWIEALKKDPGFGPGLKKIEHVHSSQTRKGSAEVCLFEIEAGW